MAVEKRENSKSVRELRNEDPISGEAGAHPVGTGVGAALGGAAASPEIGSSFRSSLTLFEFSLFSTAIFCSS